MSRLEPERQMSRERRRRVGCLAADVLAGMGRDIPVEVITARIGA
jgi:hypothetical protein